VWVVCVCVWGGLVVLCLMCLMVDVYYKNIIRILCV
jgi:hypothetical protein